MLARRPTAHRRAPLSVRALAALGATLALAFAVSGCGSDPSPEEEWASSVCTPLLDWKTSIESIVSDLGDEVQSPSASLATTLTSAVQDAKDATTTLRTDLSEVGPPPEDGEQISGLVGDLQQDLETTVNSVSKEASSLSSSSSLSEIATVVGNVSTQVTAGLSSAQQTVDQIRDAGGELASAFQDAGSCQDLTD